MGGFEIYGVSAADCPHDLFGAGEPYGLDEIPAGKWGQALGNFTEGAVVLIGSRAEILATLAAARDDVLRSFRAEHENGYHLRHPVPECPECSPGTMACPECDHVRHNVWASEWGAKEDRVRCGSSSCGHVWDPWAAAIAAGVTS